MQSNAPWSFRRSLFGLALIASGVAGQSLNYCSGENTGSDYNKVNDIYNSYGSCTKQCGDYAFAIVQWQDCWCSNYAPANQQSVGDCDQDCPGYPANKCGNEDKGLYGYLPISGNEPSGTAGSGSSSEASSTSASTSTELVSTTSSPSTSTIVSSSPDPSTSSSDSFASSSEASAVSSTVTSTSIAVVTSVSTTTQEPSTGSSRTSELTSFVAQSSTETPTPESTSSSQPPTTSSTTSTSSTSYSTPETTSSTSSTSIYVPPTTSSTTSTTSSTSSEPSLTSTDTYHIAPGPVSTTESSSSITPTPVPSPMTSVRVVTLSGARVTETVTSTPMVTPGAGAQADSQSVQKGLSDGAIAGAVVGSLLGVAAIVLGAFLLWRRKKQDNGAGGAENPSGMSKMKRNVSILSKTGLLSRVTEKEYDEPLYNTTANNSVRHSMMFGAGGAGDGISPVSPLGSSHDSQRRHSRPMVYDQRLNPSALFANHDNGSRISIQDNNDYSRPLGVTNPDPRPSFESRTSQY
ncbi:hypothetical protein KC315_g9418 [Hortaea werneckii]|nr:hypothetical protein KC324_g333 [Hortaea werneckii]KAI7320548.1 hypothetical protein KC315_g9418 [Hortaea werneckii]KAI7346456.1 hypothetical protein KC354_g14263 [Hortaea werneckii]KAI7595794.1 hypothetical protein KC316_g292 [Hortaea werneckii]